MPMPRPTILVADDTPSNIELVHEIFGDGCEILVATNGQEAVETALAEAPDLILMDVMMPLMDGFEACERLKADPRTRDIPVIYLTAVADTEAIVKGFELGGVDYVSKPFEVRELQARVRAHLDLKLARDRERALRLELETALASVRTLSGLLPICASCKKIRDDQGYWKQIEDYLAAHSGVGFTHGICPDCSKAFKAEYAAQQPSPLPDPGAAGA